MKVLLWLFAVALIDWDAVAIDHFYQFKFKVNRLSQEQKFLIGLDIYSHLEISSKEALQ
jgi:hypothetical protein